MEGMDINEADVRLLLDELTDAKNNLVHQNGYLPRHWVFGSAPWVPGHVLEDNTDLPLLQLEGPFR